jgi:hypothetical protein
MDLPMQPRAQARPDPLASALHVALTQPEPELPECYLCGSTTGPWLPDPSGARWPSGAQMLICSRRCQNEDGGTL